MQAVRCHGASWRRHLAGLLSKYNVDVEDPVRFEWKKTHRSPTKTKEFLKVLSGLLIRGDAKAAEKFTVLVRKIIIADLKAVRHSHFIVARVIENVVSVGTSIEIFTASFRKIPIYVLYSGKPENFPHWLLYYVVRSSGKVFVERPKGGLKESLEECVEYIRGQFKLEDLEKNSRHAAKARSN